MPTSELPDCDYCIVLSNNKRLWRELLYYNYNVILSNNKCSYGKLLLLTTGLVSSISRSAEAVQPYVAIILGKLCTVEVTVENTR
jgi:hypothetical protein